MAITAAITLGSAACRRGETVAAILTFTNSNASDATISDIQPLAFATGTKLPAPILLGEPNLGPGANVTIAAGSTRAISWGVTPLAPQPSSHSQAQVDAAIPGAVSQSFVFDISAEWRTSEGTSGVATATTLTVSSP